MDKFKKIIQPKQESPKVEDKITKEKVIEGIKFLIKHPNMPQKKFVNRMKKLGIDFTFEDYARQFPESLAESIFDGLMKGDLSAGASVIVNSMAGSDNRNLVYEWFLSTDRDVSLYSYLSLLTGEEYRRKSSSQLKF